MSLPVEILSLIFHYLSPEENLSSLQLVSRQFNLVANEPLLWRYYCQTYLRYWDPRHGFPTLLEKEVGTVDWKALYCERKFINEIVGELLDEIIQSTAHRLSKIEHVCEFGLDAKDYLLGQMRSGNEADDCLARRYWANTMLDSIHRGMAIDVWYNAAKASWIPGDADVLDEEGPGLDRCLSAFDMFVLHDQEYDMDWVCDRLDAMATEFRKEYRLFNTWSTRQQALTLVQWLREKKGFLGLPMLMGESDYRNLRNCLIGHALSEDDHSSLPIISCAIFQQVATRLGLQADLVSYPGHVHVSVEPPTCFDADGNPLTPPTLNSGRIYFNPHGSSDEVSKALLRRRLVEVGWQGNPDAVLESASIPETITRTANNIVATYNMATTLPDTHPSQPSLRHLRAGYPDLNLEAAKYAYMWASIMMAGVTTPFWAVQVSTFLSHVLARSYQEDMWIVEKYLRPAYNRWRETQPNVLNNHVTERELHYVLNSLRNIDNRVVDTTNRRYTQEIQQRVVYRVGDVFRHKRYGYVGVINGWTTGGSGPLPGYPRYENSSEEDASEPGTPERRGRWRTFYCAL